VRSAAINSSISLRPDIASNGFDAISAGGKIERAAAVDRISPDHTPALRRQRRSFLRACETLVQQ
jgi:hypothetical protein